MGGGHGALEEGHDHHSIIDPIGGDQFLLDMGVDLLDKACRVGTLRFQEGNDVDFGIGITQGGQLDLCKKGQDQKREQEFH